MPDEQCLFFLAELILFFIFFAQHIEITGSLIKLMSLEIISKSIIGTFYVDCTETPFFPSAVI